MPPESDRGVANQNVEWQSVSKHRHFGWSMVAVAVVAGSLIALRLGWPIYLRYLAVQRIDALGGSQLVAPRGPSWCRSLLGEQRLRSVGRFSEELTLPFAKVTTDDLKLFRDRKSTRLNSSHLGISYAVF